MLTQLDRSSAVPPRRGEQQTGSFARPGVLLQPIVDLASGSVWGHEALCRLPHSPFRYLVAGGGSSLPEEIAVVLEARMLAAALAARERVPAEQLLTVNVSPTALLNDEVQRVLADRGSLAGIVIELTEHRAPEPVEDVIPAVQALRAAGAGIALDDVGGGRGALRYARALQPDLIKLDGDVISRVHLEPMKRVMVESALAVARDLDTPVVAEGIETTDELDVLLRLGIGLGQGYLLAHPASKPANVTPHVRRWLRARSGRLAARAAVARGPRVATAS
jgi:EAL domain-containing protein (putative c-di-GMP-specific phosphodiesterase class I)